MTRLAQYIEAAERDNTRRSVQEGLLYQTRHLRLRPGVAWLPRRFSLTIPKEFLCNTSSPLKA